MLFFSFRLGPSLISGGAEVGEEETLISQMSNKLMNLSAITEPRDVISY